MNAEIISIGNELLNGITQNSNATWIADQLWHIGIPASRIVTVRDDSKAIQDAVFDSLNHVEVVLITGGLGPTHDDITKKSIAEFFKTSLVENPELKERIITRFANRGIPMPEINLEQALVPESAKIIQNKIGTAAGFYFEQKNKICVVIPGVPAEMKQMIKDSVLSLLREKYKDKIGYLVTNKIRTTGIYESKLYEVLSPILEKLPEITVAFLPHRYGVDLRLEFQAKDEKTAEDKIANAESKIIPEIFKFVYEIGERSLEQVVAEILSKKKQTLSVAESCTGGLIQNFLTNIPGSSDFFLGGVVSYSNEIKMELLDVQENTLVKYGAVSSETALEMVKGVRKLTGSDCALSITGIAGPTGGSDEKPVGLVFIGCATGRSTRVEKFIFHKERMLNKFRFAYAALNLLRQDLTD